MTRRSDTLPARLGPVFVWAVWAAMLLVALAAIARYGPEIPRAEDWFLVPALTGNEPMVGRWLWAQNSEHRVPLPQLAYLALLKLTRGDFRAAMVFDTLALAALAGAMILAARRLRGRTSYVDAFFPLVFLHLGHWDNLVWSWQIQFVLSTLLAGTFLLVIVTRGAELTPLPAGLAGICLVALPLCGANGLVLVPLFAAWLGYAALHSWSVERTPRGRRTALVLSAGVAAAAVLLAVYFVGYERASWYPASPGVGTSLKIAAQFLAMSFGPGVLVSWRVLVIATLALVAITLVLLAGEVRRGNADSRRRAFGLLCVVAAIAMLALAVGWGRAGRAATSGLSRRYALLAVPVLCAVFFAWQLYGPRRWAPRVQATLLLLAVALVPANTASGLAARDWVQAGMDAVRRDIGTGMPRPLLAERHRPFLLHWDGDRLAAGMRMLGEAGIEPFVGLREEFAVEEVRVEPTVAANDAGDVIVRLGGPRRIYAIRLPMLLPGGSPTSGRVRIAWHGTERGPRLEPVPASHPGEPEPPIATVWINDVIDDFRIASDHPAGLRGLRLLLVVPRT